MPSCRSQCPAIRRRDNRQGSYSGPSATRLWHMACPCGERRADFPRGGCDRLAPLSTGAPSHRLRRDQRHKQDALVLPCAADSMSSPRCSGMFRMCRPRQSPGDSTAAGPSVLDSVVSCHGSPNRPASPRRRPHRSILPLHSRSDGFSVCFVSSLPSPAHSWLLPSRLQRLRPPPPASNSPSYPLRPRIPQHAPASTSPTWTARSVRKTISIGS